MDKETEGYFIKDLTSRLERVERMLKWLIVEKMMTEEIWRRMGEPQLKTPDISDILDKEG